VVRLRTEGGKREGGLGGGVRVRVRARVRVRVRVRVRAREEEETHLGGGAHAHAQNAAVGRVVRLLEGERRAQQLMHAPLEVAQVQQTRRPTAQPRRRRQCTRHGLPVEERQLCPPGA